MLVADYARSLLGIEEFHARDDEVERYAEEVALYEKETGLQYTPKDKETKFIAEHLPIMLDGEATGDDEVSGFRDLERVDTNSARGGMCLVLAEGIALKAPKIQRYTRQLDEVDWPWLQDLIDGTYYDDGDADDAEDEADDDADAAEDEEGDEPSEPEGPVRAEPATKYLRDLIAGRPVFGHPSESGGFRLRYGRSRNHGFATAGVHPATMHLVDDFLATGTQIKTERPGKAAGVVPVDSIEGPTVKLANGDVRRIDDPEEALEVRNGVDEILDLGEYLVNFGEFVENNHPLVPASYAVEWWEQEFAEAGADVQALRDDPHVDLDDPDPRTALDWADRYDCPIHPGLHLPLARRDRRRVRRARDGRGRGRDRRRRATAGTQRRRAARAGAPADRTQHRRRWREPARPRVPPAPALAGRDDRTGTRVDPRGPERARADVGRRGRRRGGRGRRRGRRRFGRERRRRCRGGAVDAARSPARTRSRRSTRSPRFEIRERAPTRIGNRMGRPEKSESRDLSPAVHTMFPIGEAGGSQRDVAKAAKDRTDDGRGKIEISLGERECPDCGEHTYKNRCEDCGAHTEPYYECDECGIEVEPDESGRVVCPRCEWEIESPEERMIDLNAEYHDAMESIGEREGSFSILKGVKGLMSANETPEPMEKGGAPGQTRRPPRSRTAPCATT